jgi:type II secretory pathway component PulJ
MRKHHFSLLELLLAVAILAMALGSIMGIAVSAQDDLVRARDRWGRQHSMEQAIEYYLLADPANLSMPDGILPQGYSANVDLLIVEDGLPDHAIDPEQGWVLGEYRVVVYDDQGLLVGEQSVYKIIREDLF